MPAFEVLVTVNAGDPPTHLVVIAANKDAALKIVFDSRVAFDTDHEITIQKCAGTNYEKHPDGTLLIGFEVASSDPHPKVNKQSGREKAYRKLARDQAKKAGMSPPLRRLKPKGD